MAVTAPFSARARGGRFFRRPSRARPRRSASGAGDTPALSRHAVLVRWHRRHVAGRMLDVGRIRSGLRVVCCRLRRSCVADGGGELRRAFFVAATATAAIFAKAPRFTHSRSARNWMLCVAPVRRGDYRVKVV
jgi:hypothetical protein